MRRTRQYWLWGALGVAAVAACVAVSLMRSRAHQRPGDTAAAPLEQRPHALPTPDASAPQVDRAQDEQEAGEDPRAVAPSPDETAGNDENHTETHGSDPEPAGRELLTEEQFIELAVKIRVWQNAIADTPEGQRRFEQLVRQLLDSKGLTPADLRAFGETLDEDDADRLDQEIERGVAELNQERYTVQPKPTKGTDVLEQDARQAQRGSDKP
jgi:hypothetical protein